MKSLKQKVKRLRPLLGTYVSIELDGETDEWFLNSAITAAFEAVERVDQLMSYHRSESDLGRLNQSESGCWLEVHSETMEVLRTANELFLASDGIFDIRCGAVLAASGVLPNFSQNQHFAAALPKDMLPLEIDGRRVCKTGPWVLDLGGIAKGFAVDCAVKQIQNLSSGKEVSGIVNAGGDLRIWGKSMTTIAAQIPGEIFSRLRLLDVSETSLATSSVRGNSVASQHLTAAAHVRMPSGTFLREKKTVTVFAKECLWADALTKIVLLAAAETSARCLAAYDARALVFAPDGELLNIMD